MKTMKKLPFFVLALLFLMGCQAKPATDDTDSDVSIVEWEHSDIYTDADIQAAMDTVMTYFETEFQGCTLTQLRYPGDASADLFTEWAQEYEADEAIVLYKYMNGDFFEQLSDPNNLYWNYFHQTGEIQIGWAVDGGLDMDAVCEREKLSIEEFYAKYGTPVVTTNLYDADGFIGLLSEINSFIQNGNLKSELQYLMDQTEQAKETHRMEIVNDIYKKLHDLDYFLLRYGPKDVAKYVEDDSTVSKYYGTLPFY